MTTITVEVQDTDPKLKKLLTQVAAGKEVVFKQGDQLVARLVPVGKRIPGLHAGKVKMSSDFDKPLPDDFWAKLDHLAEEIGAHWPKGVSAADAVAEGRQ